MSNSYLRVELRSPKRGLDGGYGFDLTKYCASCWSRFGRILQRGARCGICGRRVCKRCRHFVAAKEWICSLCYKKKYTPEDSWHDDANIKRFKGSQGKGGTYLLRLTDWSAHGVLEMHKVNEFQTGRIHSFCNESLTVGYPPKTNKLYRRHHKSKFQSHNHPSRRTTFNYPLVQHDIQLKNWKTVGETMNSQSSFKEKHLKYTSVNLKQKRREMRECRAMSIGRGSFPDGMPNECYKKKSYFNRISSTKREYFESSKTLSHDYDNSLTPSTRRAKHNFHSCTTSSSSSSWQKEHSRRSRRNNGNSFSQPATAAVLHRSEPHVRLSVRGTRIFGRRKSYRACPTLKGDARANTSALLRCRSSTSLPCELSQVDESHDYEFWNSGFVQSRVRKLEEELTSKCCDDKYSSYSHEYEVQSLCSLQLDKILPDGDDYRIAYLSSTSQESSLDYMDDNYCTIGMGTLDVKLNKKYPTTGSEDWDLSFSSNEENDTSSDDDEFFYRRYSNTKNDSTIVTPNRYSRNICIPNNCSDILHVSKQEKKYSCVGNLDDTKSITQQIHESVDRIFYNVMNYDLDIPHSVKEKQNKSVTLEYFSCPPNEKIPFTYCQGDGKETKWNKPEKNISSYTSDHSYMFKNFQNEEQNDNALHSPTYTPCQNLIDNLKKQKSPENIPTDDFFNYENVKFENFVPAEFSDLPISRINHEDAIENERLNNNFPCDSNPNFPLEDENVINNLQITVPHREKINSISKCLFSENKSIVTEQEQVNILCADFSQPASKEFQSVQDSEIKLLSATAFPLSQSIKSEVSNSDISKNIPSEKNLNYIKNLALPMDNFEILSENFSEFNIPNNEINSISKCNVIESRNVKCFRNFQNGDKRLKYKMKRDRWADNEKTKFMPQTNSFLEVELILYEPLCTPFSEIYFITYGKKYPTKCCYKLSIPRKILRDVEKEMILTFINQNNLSFKQLHSSITFICLASQRSNAIKSGCFETDVRNNSEKLNSVHSLFTNSVIQNHTQQFAIESIEQCGNFKFNGPSHLMSNNNNLSSLNFIFLSSDIKNIQYNPKLFSDKYLRLSLRNGKEYFQKKSGEYGHIAIFGFSELSENVNTKTNFQVIQNDLNRFLNDESDNIPSTSAAVSLPQSGSKFPKPVIRKYVEFVAEIKQKNVWRRNKVISLASIFEYFNQFFRILNSIKLLSDDNKEIIIDVSHLEILSSSFLLTMKNIIENSSETDLSSLEFVKDGNLLNKSSAIKVKNNDCHKMSRISETRINIPNSGYTFDFFKYSDCFPGNQTFKTTFSLKRKTEKYFTETNKISKDVSKILKTKKCRNKKWDTLFRNIYLSKSSFDRNVKFNSVPICNETIEDILISLGQNVFISENCQVYQQMRRNRNYGISYYTQKETEITNEVPHTGETSESRFTVESQPKATTSLTGNATFVEYLFPPQLASVRDTAKAHLSGSAIQHFQSVPAVQQLRLVDRESRFIQSDLEHGSFNAASASEAASITDINCLCGDSVDICVSSDGYPIIFNNSEAERITCSDHDFKDYLCFGSVPKGLQQLICNQVPVGDINWDKFNPGVPSSELHQNMATCGEDPRLINKPTRTPGRNISKLKKLFDSRDGVASDSDISYSRNDDNSSISSHSVNVNKTTSPPQSIENKPETSDHISNSVNGITGSLETDTSEITTYKSQQRISSDIPYCRKASSGGDLWKNVDTGLKSSSGVLWNSIQNNDNLDDSPNDQTDLRQGSNSFVSSTADLHNLIASSRAELSKKKEPELSDKSTLENYFTSFENSKPKKCVPSTDLIDDSSDFLIPDNETTFKTSVTYGCDVDEMNFDDEEVTLSDTSSDEEIRCNPPNMNTHYLPAYALHTIIEESCEESERDSRGPTPTNEPVTSKLERYFSWDIINDTERDGKRMDDDSTVFSDSLSEGSGSLNDEASKEIDPSHLASSRLEKYFTSGLVGNENYFYPDDAEFLEDAPVSDFEEDSIHQKISRSALLSSLETVAEPQTSELPEENNKELALVEENIPENNPASDNVSLPDPTPEKAESCDEDAQSKQDENDVLVTPGDIDDCSAQSISEVKINEAETQNQEPVSPDISDTSFDKPADVLSCDTNNLETSNIENSEPEIVESAVVNGGDVLSPKQTVSKEQLAIDVRAIIKKLLMYFSDTGSKSFKHNMESDYISAWQILETEIERLIQSISPTVSLENNSCNSSTIDSNNSDYGSDTIESIECITDEDEAADSKNRGNAKYPIVELFNAAYKIQPGPEFYNFNISDETLSIWKRLIQSLQKDSFCMNDNKLYDPNTEARLYIRDQIVNLMHTVTVSESKVDEIDQNVLNIQDKHQDIASSLIEESNSPEEINEAFNVSVNSSSLLTYCEDSILTTTVPKEPSDEGISVESSEIVKTCNNILDNESKFSSDSDVDIECALDSNRKLSETSENDIVLNSYLYPSVNSSKAVHQNTNLCPEKINVDEVDLKLNNRKSNDNPNFSLCVNIDLGDNSSNGQNSETESTRLKVDDDNAVKRSSLHLWVSGETDTIKNDKNSSEQQLTSKDDSLYVQDDLPDLPPPADIDMSSDAACATSDAKIHNKSCRDTGYYSFKSSDDSILHDTPPPDEFMDVPNFKSLKRSVKKFPLNNTLSKSTTNINQVLSVPDTKFSTLQLKSHKPKGSSSFSSPSRQFTSLFSPSAVFKKLTGSKGNDTQTTDSSIPAKYLKKYARSSSIDSESMVGAISMPQLNFPKASDSYSALGLYSENDRDSSLIADDDIESKRYPAYSHSVLSLGAHSVSMTSVYSAAACHYGYVTISGDVLFGLNYNQKSQMMEVFVKQCRNLAAVDIRRNKSDPYVKVYLLPDKTKSGKRKTKTKKNTLNPIFNELLRFPVLKHELESRTLWLSVWNSDLFGRNDFLGEITLPLGYRLLDSPTLRWYPLQERMESLTSPLNYRGELFLALKYVPRDLSLESRFRPAPVISLRGALHILVKEARNISANGSGGNLDAFCKSYLLPDKSKSSKQKTPVVKKSRHPKWYYTVIYEDLSIDELKERSLELTVWDHDKITSNEFMGGIRLNLGSGLYHGVSVEWMDAKRDEAALWEAMLQSPNMWVDGCLPLRPTMQFHHG